MDVFGPLLGGIVTVLSWQNLLFALIGAVLGTIVGILPGLGPTRPSRCCCRQR